MSSPTQQLSDLGVSIWLDDMSRDRIQSHSLQQLIDERNVVGATTNPTIFANALAAGESYDAQVAELAKSGAGVTDAVFEITTMDVTMAADVFRPIFQETNGLDGRISIEVEPGLAYDTEGTVAQALELWKKVDRPNAMIKIPATEAGLDAITQATAAGVSVNVTLIFGLERYRGVIDAYLTGLEQARDAGRDLASIRSVASFFVSRVDTEIDKRLDAIATEASAALRGKAGVANARLAYEVYEQAFETDRARALLRAGAHRQRPLWASTGVKDPALPDTLYVTGLAVADTVNTMPEKTLEATFDHAIVTGDEVTGNYDSARAVITAVEEQGISLEEVTELLEKEGVDKFVLSWNELLDTIAAALEAAR